jgi:hypothetical protein
MQSVYDGQQIRQHQSGLLRPEFSIPSLDALITFTFTPQSRNKAGPIGTLIISALLLVLSSLCLEHL